MVRFFLSCFFALACVQAAPVIEMGSERAPVRYEMSCTELQCRPDGAQAHPIAIAPAEQTLDAVAAEIATRSARVAATFDLVFYPAGKAKTARNRRVFGAQIAVTDAVAAGLRLPLGCVAKPHATAPGWTLLTYRDAPAALRHFQQLVAEHGREAVRPLLRKQRHKRRVPTDPRYAYSPSNTSYQWHLNNTGQNGAVAGIDANIETVWDDYRGTGIDIGIVDDGLENAHPDLSANADTTRDRNWNAGDENDATPLLATDDHGTSCAGVAAARDDNGEGGVGAAPLATLVGLRLIAGDVGDAQEAEALGWERGSIEIYSNSWGPDDEVTEFEKPGPLLLAALQAGLEQGRGGKGSIFVFAGGNGHENGDASNHDGYANHPGTIAVGAIDDDGDRAVYSERGANLVISAPSDGAAADQAITTATTVANGTYTDGFGGTSSATPLVAGVVALMLEANPALGWRDVQEILIRSARKVKPTDAGWTTTSAGLHFHHDYGAGMVDAAAAVALAETWTNVPDAISREVQSGTLGQSLPTSYDIDFTNVEDITVEHAVLTLDLDGVNIGQLDIRLTAPDGTVSQLLVPHATSSTELDLWEFSSVRHWGTDSSGTWRVDISRPGQTGSAGTLRSAALRLDGPMGSGGSPQAPTITSGDAAEAFVGTPFSYQITASFSPTSFAATNLPSWATIDAAGLITGTPDVAGQPIVTLMASNAEGTGQKLLNINVSAAPGDDLAAALEIAGAAVFSEGEADWVVETVGSQVGGSHVRSTTLGDGQSMELRANVTATTVSQLSFWWQTSTEYGYDKLTVRVDDVAVAELSGERGWQQVTMDLAAGDHTVAWVFARDSSMGGGQNRVAIDGVTITPLSQILTRPSERYGQVLTTHLPLVGTPVHWPTAVVGGDDVLSSPATVSSGSSQLTATVVGPGELTFDMGCSSEEEFDVATFAVGANEIISLSGEVPLTGRQVSIPAGSHELKWRFEKDATNSVGDDRLLLRNVRYEREGSYEEFASTQFSAAELQDLSLSAAGADADGDGRSNMMEWLVQSDLREPTFGNVLTVDGYGVRFTRRAVAPEVYFTLQACEDLVSWLFIPHDEGAVANGEVVVTAEGGPNFPTFFYRLTVEQDLTQE